MAIARYDLYLPALSHGLDDDDCSFFSLRISEESMRAAKVELTRETTKSIPSVIQRDPQLIDGVYSLLEELHKEGKGI